MYCLAVVGDCGETGAALWRGLGPSSAEEPVFNAPKRSGDWSGPAGVARTALNEPSVTSCLKANRHFYLSCISRISLISEARRFLRVLSITAEHNTNTRERQHANSYRRTAVGLLSGLLIVLAQWLNLQFFLHGSLLWIRPTMASCVADIRAEHYALNRKHL